MRPQVVIIGGGFGGLACARGLARTQADIKLVDRRNFHLFQPLLYQVATGGLSPANIAAPLRSILRRQKNTQVLLAEVADFDCAAQRVDFADGQSLHYDYLVLATGATTIISVAIENGRIKLQVSKQSKMRPKFVVRFFPRSKSQSGPTTLRSEPHY